MSMALGEWAEQRKILKTTFKPGQRVCLIQSPDDVFLLLRLNSSTATVSTLEANPRELEIDFADLEPVHAE